MKNKYVLNAVFWILVFASFAWSFSGVSTGVMKRDNSTTTLTTLDTNYNINIGAGTLTGGIVNLGTATSAGSIAIHDAGTVTLNDDGDNTSVIIGPVADGTTTLGVTGSLDVSGTVDAGNAVLTGGTNTFNITNGTASIDVAAGSAVDVNQNLTVSGSATTFTNGLTFGATNAGTIDFSTASKTLTIEDNSLINQDLTSDASPTFAGSTMSGLNTANGIVQTDGSGVLSTTLTPSGLTSISATTVTANSASLTGGTNTFNITNGTASLDVAAGSAVDVNANLTVESAATVNQDTTTDASPTFAGGTFTGRPNLTVGSGASVIYSNLSDKATLNFENMKKSGFDAGTVENIGKVWSDLGQLASETKIYSLSYLGNGIVLAGTSPNGKIFRSTDYGATWSDLGQQASETSIFSLTYLGNGIALAGTSPNGKIFRSTDYGATWSDLDQLASETRIYSLAYLGNGIAIAGAYTNGKIFRSTDYGATWSDLGQQESQTHIQSLTYLGNGVALAGTYPNGKIFRSTDYGETWSDLGQQASEAEIVSLAYLGNGIVLAGTVPNGKIFRSTDYGATWSDLGQLASETRIYSLAYLGNGIAIAGAYPNGKIFRSTDYGATWSDLDQQASETVIYSLAYLGNGIALAGTSPNGKIFRSTSTSNETTGKAWIFNGVNIYNNSGNVGIGTNSPPSKLSVSANRSANGGLETLDSSDSDNLRWDIRMDGSGHAWLEGFDASETSKIVFHAAGASYINGGNIGIGEAAPETLIEATSTVPYLTLHNNTEEDTDGGRESKILFKGEQSGTEETTLASIVVQHDGTSDDEKGAMIFSVNDGNDANAPTEAMRIDSVGGIRYTPTTDQVIEAATGLTAAMLKRIVRVAGNTGNIDITADPQIVDGTDGQIIMIQGTSDTDTVQFDDGTGLGLAGGVSFTVGQGDILQLVYDSGDDLWYEISRSDN